MRKGFITLSLIIFVSSSLFAQDDLQYRKTLKKMFEVSGSEEAYRGVIVQMTNMFQQQYTNVSAEVWREFEKEFLQASFDDLVEMLVPVYKKYLTHTDLLDVIKFYETPIGKKYATNTPLIMQESMQVGQMWGQKLGEEFAKKMQSMGYLEKAE